MKKITLNRNGQTCARNREISDLKAGRFQVCEHVMLGITGDCCYHRKGYAEYVVAKVEPCDRFGGGRETVTFERVLAKADGKRTTARVQPLSPEAELAATVARQRGDMCHED